MYDMFHPFVSTGRQLDVAMASRHRWVTKKNASGEPERCFKASFRFYIQDMAVAYPDLRRIIMKARDDLKRPQVWDVSPYKSKEQLLNCIHCFKTDVSNPGERLLPVQACKDMPTSAFVVQAMSGNEVMIPSFAEPIPRPVGQIGKPLPPGFLASFLKCFSVVRCSEYKTWYETLQTIVNVYGHEGEGYEAALAWSRTVPNFPGVHDFDKAWWKLRVRGENEQRLTIGSIIHWALVDSPDKARVIKLDLDRPPSSQDWFMDADGVELVPDLKAIMHGECTDKLVASVMKLILGGNVVCMQEGKTNKWALYEPKGAPRGLWKVGDTTASVNWYMSDALDKVTVFLEWWVQRHVKEEDQASQLNHLRIIRRQLGNARSLDGPRLMLQPLLYDPKFARRLDHCPWLLAFDNGVYDLENGLFRPYKRDDLISLTIGYDYVPAELIPEQDLRAVDELYEQWTPVEEERDVLKRFAAYTVSGNRTEKKIALLLDERPSDLQAGDNGKSQWVSLLRHTMGNFSASTKSDLLYKRIGRGIDDHNAGLLAFNNMRLAPFDEISPSEVLDTEQVKRCLAGGSTSEEQVRNFHSANSISMRWTVFGVIACNKINFPQVSSTDGSTSKRFVPLPFRSKFTDDPSYTGQDYVFPIDIRFAEKLQRLKVPHMARMLQWYHDLYTGRGLGDVTLPASCLRMRKEIFSSADVVVAKIQDFINEHVALGIQAEQLVHGGVPFIKRTDLLKEFREANTRCKAVLKARSSDLKDKLDSVMSALGFGFCSQKWIGDVNFKDGYHNVCWIHEITKNR
jgi:phage/plasmid-associated DNA primase